MDGKNVFTLMNYENFFKCNFLYKMQDIECDLNMFNALLLYG